MFNDHHIVAKPSPIAVGYDEWLLFNALWLKFYNSHGKYRPELNEYFQRYEYQLSFAMFCATSALGISWQHLNHPNLILLSVYRFHAYFYIWLILHHLGISLPYEDSFSKVKSSYIKSAYYSICDDYGGNADKTLMHGNWFYTTSYGIFDDGRKATKRSPPDNLKWWIITQSDGYTRKCIEKISRSERADVYLFITSQIEARSSIAGNLASAVYAQQIFWGTFKALINEDYSVSTDNERYQGVLEHAITKVDFSIATGVYMLPSNFKLKHRKDGRI